MKNTVQLAYSDSPGLCISWRKAVSLETLKSIFPSTPPNLAQKRQKMLKASLWDKQLDSVLIQGMKRDQHSRRCILLGIFWGVSLSWAASQPLASAGELQSQEAGRTDVQDTNQPGDELKTNSIFDCYAGENRKSPVCSVQKNASVQESLLLCRACDHDSCDVVKVKGNPMWYWCANICGLKMCPPTGILRL